MQRVQQITDDEVVLFDPNKVRNVLARASEIDQRKTDALSAAQIETLGTELGLSPDAVRLALQEVSSDATLSLPVSSYTAKQQTCMAEKKATIHSAVQSFLWLTCALFLGGLVDDHNNGSPSGAVLVGAVLGVVLFLLPPVLAFVAGRRAGNARVGATRGFWAGAAMIVLLLLSVAASPLDYPGMVVARLWIILYLLVAPVTLGAIGGAIQKRRNQRKQQNER